MTPRAFLAIGGSHEYVIDSDCRHLPIPSAHSSKADKSRPNHSRPASPRWCSITENNRAIECNANLPSQIAYCCSGFAPVPVYQGSNILQYRTTTNTVLCYYCRNKNGRERAASLYLSHQKGLIMISMKDFQEGRKPYCCVLSASKVCRTR